MINDQPILGILLLDTTFPRIPGDIGNEASFPFPVMIKKVAGATVQRIIYEPDPALKDLFIEAAISLVEEGAAAITSSCGFLSPIQKDIATSVDVPVFLSSLMQAPLIYHMTQRPVGIFTANARKLTELVLENAGITSNIPIQIMDMEDVPAFREPILMGGSQLDFSKIQEAIVQKAFDLLRINPEIGSFLFECHNLSPYSLSVHKATGKAVFDIIDFAKWVYGSVNKQAFSDMHTFSTNRN